MPAVDQSVVVTATIANGQTQSSTLNIGADTIVGIQTPAALTSTAFTFEVSTDGSTWTALRDSSGTAVSLTVTTNKAYSLPGGLFAPWDYARIIAGSAEGGSRTITVALLPPNAAAPLSSSSSGSSSVTVTSIPARNDQTDSISVGVSATATAATVYVNTALSNTATAVKSSAGHVYSFFFDNSEGTAAAYVSLHNVAAGSVSVGSSTGLMVRRKVPTGGTAEIVYPVSGIAFGTAISIVAHSTRTGSGAPGTALHVEVDYI